MIPKDAIESAYCFFHQKWNVYRKSTMDWQKDDIEWAISTYVQDMNAELYQTISRDRKDFLKEHVEFADDLENAVEQLEAML